MIAPALKELLNGLIDYAGMFPPAALKIEVAINKFETYETGDYSWMLGRLVMGTNELDKAPHSLDGRLSILSESDQPRAGSIESKGVITAAKSVYCEIALDNLDEQLDRVKSAGVFAKIRTGGIKAEAIPSPGQVAGFIRACAKRRLGFKATAGLHHPIRGMYPLTYETDAPRAVMHGFINLLMAAALALYDKADPEKVLSETDPSAFSFDDSATWRGVSLTAAQINQARRDFVHSIGSCSFEEPVEELIKLGWLS
jgi:hypothetical protein